MHEILTHLDGGYVLDLGSRFGSFDPRGRPFVTVRVDLDPPAEGGGACVVKADAARLPFRDGCFAAVISNHSLEHFEQLGEALGEVGRVSGPGAAFYAAVPDATTVTDRLYRWLARGGGHVNAFRSADALANLIERKVGLRHTGSRLLYTSLSFLNSKNRRSRAPRKLILLGGGREWTLVLFNGLFRIVDRLLGTRTAVYGWALYFGQVSVPVETVGWVNACARCGSGHSLQRLAEEGRIRRVLGLVPTYRCPDCGARNLFFSGGGFSRK